MLHHTVGNYYPDYGTWQMHILRFQTESGKACGLLRWQNYYIHVIYCHLFLYFSLILLNLATLCSDFTRVLIKNSFKLYGLFPSKHNVIIYLSG